MTTEAEAGHDPAVVLGELEQLGQQWRSSEARRDELITARRRLVVKARACDPPLARTKIAQALGVSQPFVSRLLDKESAHEP